MVSPETPRNFLETPRCLPCRAVQPSKSGHAFLSSGTRPVDTFFTHEWAAFDLKPGASKVRRSPCCCLLLFMLLLLQLLLLLLLLLVLVLVLVLLMLMLLVLVLLRLRSRLRLCNRPRRRRRPMRRRRTALQQRTTPAAAC